MKRVLRVITFVATIAMSIVACQKPEIVAPTATHTVKFTAAPLQTKTSATVSGDVVNYAWTKADENRFTIYEIVNGQISEPVEAIGNLNEATGAMSLVAEFPGDEVEGATYRAILNTQIKDQQVIASSTLYDQESDVLVSEDTGSSHAALDSDEGVLLRFERKVAMAQATIKGLEAMVNLSKVEIESLDNTVLAASYDIPSNQFATTGSTKITIRADEKGDGIWADEESNNFIVRFITLPVSNAQLKMTVYAVDNDDVEHVFEKTFGGLISFTQGNMSGFGVSGFTELEDAPEATSNITFKFKSGGSDSSDAPNAYDSNASDVFSEGAGFVKNVNVEYVYPARTSVRGAKFGSSKQTGTLSFELNDAVRVKQISVNACPYSDTEGQDGFTLNGKTIEMTNAAKYNHLEYVVDFNGEEISTITIAAVSKRLFIEGLTIECFTAPDKRSSVNMTGFATTDNVTNIIKGMSVSTSVENDQPNWTASYLYESSDAEVATVDENGVITAVGKGTATITASLNIASDDENWKKGETATKTIEITVNNASHTARFSINGTINESNTRTVEEGSNIEFPENPQLDDVVFMGWTTDKDYNNVDAAPTDLCNSAEMGDNDVTYYAVFAEASAGNTYTQITALNALEAGARYLIVGNSSSTYKALPVDKAENLTTVTPSSSKISNPAADLIWTLEGVAKQWKIRSVSNGKYLQISGGNLTFETSTSITFDGSVSSSKFTFTSSATSGNKVLSYYANGSKFNAYTTANNVYLYKASVTYSNYTTIVKSVTGVTVKTSPSKVDYCEGENFDPAGLEVTLTYADATTRDVVYGSATASKFTFSPALDAALLPSNDNVQITINGKACNQSISVRSVVINAPVVTEGTYTVKVGDAEAIEASGSTISALKGQRVVLDSSPAAGYKAASTPFAVTDEDGNNVSVSTAGGQYSFTMPDKDVTISAKFTQVFTVTAGVCSNGQITAIKDVNDNRITETSKGSIVRVEAMAADHYHLASMYYVKDNDEAHNAITADDGVYSFTMPQSNVTVFATFEDDTKYTVSWRVNGEEVKSQQVYANVPVSAPEVGSINGKEFKGWIANEIDGVQNTVPSFVNVSNLTINEDKVFYAVFATSADGGEVTEELTNAEVNSLSSSSALVYAKETTYSDGSVDYSIYAYTDNTNRKWIQIKKDKGVYVKITAPMPIKRVEATITSPTNSSGGINDISKHTAFSGTVALCAEDCAYTTTSNSVASTSTITSNVATLNPSGDNTSLYLKVSTGARIWGVSVTYGSYSYVTSF